MELVLTTAVRGDATEDVEADRDGRLDRAAFVAEAVRDGDARDVREARLAVVGGAGQAAKDASDRDINDTQWIHRLGVSEGAADQPLR